MTNVALQNYVQDLIRQWEKRSNRSLDSHDMVEEFGFATAKAIERLADGLAPDGAIDSTVLAVVRALGGDSEDAAAVIRLLAGRIDGGEDVITLNSRLLTRLQNLERFVRRTGQLEAFRKWVESGAAD